MVSAGARSRARPLSDLVSLRWSGRWDSLLSGPARAELETAALPRFLQAQRWFGGKSREVAAVRVNSHLLLPQDGTSGPGPVLVFARVEYSEGPGEDYFLPLAVATDREADLQFANEPDSVIARLEGDGGFGVLFDGLFNRELVTALVGVMAGGRTLEGRPRLRGDFTPALQELLWSRDGYRIARGPATSSNSFVLVGDQLFLKVFRRLEPGINPDVEIGEYLTRRGASARVPRLAGTLSAQTERGELTLAILQEKVESDGDGWEHTLQLLERYFCPAWGRPELPKASPLELATAEPPPRLYRTLAESRVSAGLLGTRTAELHVALAKGADDPAFAPEMMSSDDFDRLRLSIHSQAGKAWTLLKARYRDLPEYEAETASRLLAREREIVKRIDASVPSCCAALRIRIHGDYHLGQVLWTGQDYVILDFEGEPMRPLEERRAKQSPFRDVAGMLRSFHYAAFTASRMLNGEPSTDGPAWAQAWYVWTSAAFLRDYLLTAHLSGLVPEKTHAEMHGLMDAYLLEKAFYELAYELNNRPDWVGIPLRGLLDILDT